MSNSTSWKAVKRKAAQVGATIDSLLASESSDAELRHQLEAQAEHFSFDTFTWRWGPELYRRNRLLFRPLILAHFGQYDIDGNTIFWKGAVGAALEAWLQQVDAANDIELFRYLYRWKISTGKWKVASETWRRDLLARYSAATARHERNTVLAKFDDWMELDESTAIALYERDPVASRAFILKHSFSWGKSRLWKDLLSAARNRQDDDFWFDLYRAQVDEKTWRSDAIKLASAERDPETLCAELSKRHPKNRGLDLGQGMYELMSFRGRDILPYVQQHLHDVWGYSWRGRGGYKRLVKLAAEKQWWDLWSGLVRTCGTPDEYNAAVRELLDNSQLATQTVENRLLMLTGASREWNFGPFGFAQVKQLTDKVAVALYGRFPTLLRGPFRMNLSFGYFNDFSELVDAVIAQDDEIVLDYLASRAITWVQSPWAPRGRQAEVVEKLSRYYEGLQQLPERFSRQCVSVLSQIPAYTIFSYNQLIRTNRLARLMYQRTGTVYLEDAAAVRDLLEAPEIHVQALALRTLGLSDPRARKLAADNLDLLQATLLRPLHRETRALAFRALENAAVDLGTARTIYLRSRQAMDLPDKKYPKESLIGLLGRLLKQFPELRGPRENPVVYGGMAHVSSTP